MSNSQMNWELYTRDIVSGFSDPEYVWVLYLRNYVDLTKVDSVMFWENLL